MFTRFLKSWRMFEEVMSGLDDPHSIELDRLERRILAIEQELALRAPSVRHGDTSRSNSASRHAPPRA